MITNRVPADPGVAIYEFSGAMVASPGFAPALATILGGLEDDLPPLNVAGCSGGPVFLLRPSLVLVPQLCGLVKEGWAVFGGDDIVLRFARLDVTLNADGGVRSL
jgi:hypothetical protein